MLEEYVPAPDPVKTSPRSNGPDESGHEGMVKFVRQLTKLAAVVIVVRKRVEKATIIVLFSSCFIC